jgi:hypothetical protein
VDEKNVGEAKALGMNFVEMWWIGTQWCRETTNSEVRGERDFLYFFLHRSWCRVWSLECGLITKS